MNKLRVFLSAMSILGLAAVQAALAAAPGREITFTYGTMQATATLDPAKHTDETQSIIVMNAYDPLLYPVKGGAPRPHLAISSEVSSDGTTYTFKLREGVKFHDGSELTAEDVAFSMDRVLRIGKGFAWLWKDVLPPGQTTAVDKYTVRFVLKQPHAPFLASLVQFFPVNKRVLLANKKDGAYGEFGDYSEDFLNKRDAGTGPYVVETYEPGAQLVFRKFDPYWRGWKPNQIERAVMRIIGEQATLKLMLQKGELDMVEQWLPPEAFEDLKKTRGIMVKEDPSAQLFFLGMNNQKAPLDRIEVRKAISFAFDYATAAREIFKGAAQARGPVPLLMPGHNEKTLMYTRDVAKAKELLAKAGVAPGTKLRYLFVQGIESERKIGLLLQSNLKEIGLDLEIQDAPWARVVEMASKPETTPHFVAIFHTAKYPHPDSHTYLMFHPNAWGTFMSLSWYRNEEVSRTLEQARRTVDSQEQLGLYGKAQEIVADEAAALFVSNSIHRIAYRDHVKGYDYNGILGYDLVWYNLTVEK